MKTNIEQSANTASVVRGRMCEVLTCGAYIEQGSVVKMTTVTTGQFRNEFHPKFRERSLQALLRDGCAVAVAWPMPQFHQKTNERLRVEKRPSCPRADSIAILQNVNAFFVQERKDSVHVLRLKQNMMDAGAFFIEKLPISVVLTFEWLDQLEFQHSCLSEGLPNFDVLPPASEIILRLRPVRPLNELKRTDAEQRAEEPCRLFEVRNDNTDLHGAFEFYSSGRSLSGQDNLRR